MGNFAEKPHELWAGVSKCWLSSICQTKFLPDRYFFTRKIYSAKCVDNWKSPNKY